MPTISHKNLINVPNTAEGDSDTFKLLWAGALVRKAAGWKYVASSDGTTVDTSYDPALDRWLNSPGTLGTLTTSGSSAVVAAPSRGRALVTGLTGMSGVHKGQFLKLIGSAVSANNNVHQIEEIVSTTSVKIDARNFAVAADAVPRSFEIRNPLGETYNAALSTGQAWRVEIGPSTFKVPITAATSTRFIVGERVIQASSGFEGEFRSTVWNASTSTGYLTLFGQVRGTGGGVYGLTNGQVITGQTSNATAVHSGTAEEFVNEHVVWKKSASTKIANIWYGVFNTVGETRFTSPATLSAATATTAPGGSATGSANFPPIGAYISVGTTNALFSVNIVRASTTATALPDHENVWAICADAIEEIGYSADGSFFCAVRQRTVNQWAGIGYQLFDGGDYGDVAPWCSYTGAGNAAPGTAGATHSATATVSMPNTNSYYGYALCDALQGGSGQSIACRGWGRRGFGDATDTFMPIEMAIPLAMKDHLLSATFGDGVMMTRSQPDTGGSGTSEASYSNTHEAHVPVLTTILGGAWRTRYDTAVNSGPAPYVKYVKGSPRWIRTTDHAQFNTLHDRTFLQMSGRGVSICIGPFNEVPPTLSHTRLYMSNWIGTQASCSPLTRASSVRFADGTVIDTSGTIPADPGATNWLSQIGTGSHFNCSPLMRNKGTTGTGSTIKSNFIGTANTTTACYRFTSAPIAAQTISGTVKGQCYASLAAGSAGHYVAARMYVLSPLGVVRGVLRELLPQANTSGGLEITTTITNRKIFRDGTLTPVVCLQGDVIVLEVGVRIPGTAAITRIAFGDTLLLDLPEDETTTGTTTYSGWIEFSTPVVFYDGPSTLEGTVLINGPSTIGGAGYAPPTGGGAVLYYINRVYDSIASKFVKWSTTSPDTTGTSYPGPGTFGVTTSNYVVAGTYTV